MERFITANGCALRVSDSQHGATVILLLHGYLESLDVWEDFAKLLARGNRVIAIDLPGHGISQVMGEVHTMAFLADTVAAAAKELGAERFCAVGHSMGGYVALELMNRHPEMLTGLVLLHSTPNADSEAKREMRKREAEIVRSGKKELLALTAPEKGFAAGNREKFAEQITALKEQVAITDDEGITALLGGMMQREDLNEAMRRSDLPQLVILGRRDEHITPDIAEALVKAQPQARVVWMEESGHNSFIEESEKCASEIQYFVSSLR